jgi:GntR family transcriptional regulator
VSRDRQMPTERVVSDLRSRIASDEWASGEALPTVTQLAERYGVSRATISKALRALVAERLVVTRPRWGTFKA